MIWTPELKAFIAQHIADDIDRLLLSSQRYPDIDVREAVEQILARRQIKTKLPEWYALDDIIMGGRIPAEQCSSEPLARHKRRLVVGDSLCDLTGGMGVDFYYMSQGLKKAIYTERQSHLVEAMAHNLRALYGEAPSPEFILREGDGRDLPLPDVDTIYLDPARRATDGSRVYDIAECEPNVVEWQEVLLNHCQKLLIKLSPMADISRLLQQLHRVTAVHIMALRNECKEVLVEMAGYRNNQPSCSIPLIGKEISPSKPEFDKPERVRVYCVDYRSTDIVSYNFEYGCEQKTEAAYVDSVDFRYLYEPDVTLLKAGAFKQVCADFGVRKLEKNSHYYASDILCEQFPGRSFEVEEVLPFSGKMIKSLKKILPQANISARNFPLTADQLRARSGIRDGGPVYLIATTVMNYGAMIFRCHKALLVLLLFVMTLALPQEACARRKSRKSSEEKSVSAMLQMAREESPFLWAQGMPFVYMKESLSPILQSETVLSTKDTVSLKGSVWHFDAIVSEEDWMGQQKMQLRFFSPSGTAFRFNTERVMTQEFDTAYRPALSVLQPLEMLTRSDSILRARSLYILINDERIIGGEDVSLEKFVPVTIDSITAGSELAPLHVWFTQGDNHASFLTSLPESRESAMSTPIDRFLSVSDPYLLHDNITKDIWSLIKRNMIQIGMTTEEVRLSLGRPLRFERFNSKNGSTELWYYPNSRVLEFWDGRLMRQGRTKQ